MSRAVVRPESAPSVSHDVQDGSLQARARWFQSLSDIERLEWLAAHQQLAWDMNGGRMPRKHYDARSLPERCEVLELPQGPVRRHRR
ncbi:hypothetical protein [Planctellipticum variicoloris]|uniref:hypothetical protein n=1 Tax=Planctellipticum variicoloris TaxID=3064265 RepID=UPI0030133489|nr:hypothetical protein SH412_002931 [Planctomycetaceae bacterium SH412]